MHVLFNAIILLQLNYKVPDLQNPLTHLYQQSALFLLEHSLIFPTLIDF